MTAKERMYEALTNLLRNGEVLMCPIYGVLEQGTGRYYGYFGFTERFLLLALFEGETVTYTSRVPLDIRSVQIRKEFFLNEHIININFNEGNPCRISTFPRVLGIDSQKENLVQFLSHLQSKAQHKGFSDLNQLNGTKIRKQPFNWALYAFLAFLLPLIPILFILECKKQGVLFFQAWHILADITVEALPSFSFFIIPLFVLSVLSKLWFGGIVAVVEESGVYLNGTFVPWKDIKEVVYTMPHYSKVSYRAAYITVRVSSAQKREVCIEVSGFTLYGLRILRKHLPKQSVRWAKGERPLAVFLGLLPTLLMLLFVLI